MDGEDPSLSSLRFVYLKMQADIRSNQYNKVQEGVSKSEANSHTLMLTYHAHKPVLLHKCCQACPPSTGGPLLMQFF